MKTALQELMQWMEETEFMVNVEFIDKVNECLEKEKEQIKKAYEDGKNLIQYKDEWGEKYYNQTYKNK